MVSIKPNLSLLRTSVENAVKDSYISMPWMWDDLWQKLKRSAQHQDGRIKASISISNCKQQFVRGGSSKRKPVKTAIAGRYSNIASLVICSWSRNYDGVRRLGFQPDLQSYRIRWERIFNHLLRIPKFCLFISLYPSASFTLKQHRMLSYFLARSLIL